MGTVQCSLTMDVEISCINWLPGLLLKSIAVAIDFGCPAIEVVDHVLRKTINLLLGQGLEPVLVIHGLDNRFGNRAVQSVVVRWYVSKGA